MLAWSSLGCAGEWAGDECEAIGFIGLCGTLGGWSKAGDPSPAARTVDGPEETVSRASRRLRRAGQAQHLRALVGGPDRLDAALGVRRRPGLRAEDALA